MGRKFDLKLNIMQETDSEQVALAKVAKNSGERVKSPWNHQQGKRKNRLHNWLNQELHKYNLRRLYYFSKGK